MHTTLRVTAAASLLALAAAGPAHATAVASAQIGTVTITLIDLDLSDGIAPALTWSGEQSYSYASTTDAGSLSDWASGWYMPTSATVNGAFGWGSGITEASGASGNAEVSGSPSAGSDYNASGQGQFWASFEVTPWTGVILTTTVSGQASTSIGNDGVYSEWASATSQLSLSVDSADGWESHYAYRNVYVGYSPDSQSFGGTLKLTYANLSGDTLSGSYYASAYASTGSTMPVPEPGSYAMLLAGLLGIGLVVGKRRI